MSDLIPTTQEQVTTVLPDARVTCEACPLQVEGTYRGAKFYFRARHEHWTLGIGDTEDAAVAASFNGFGEADGHSIYRIGEGGGASHRYGEPEPDRQEEIGTFGIWLLSQLEMIFAHD